MNLGMDQFLTIFSKKFKNDSKSPKIEDNPKNRSDHVLLININ